MPAFGAAPGAVCGRAVGLALLGDRHHARRALPPSQQVVDAIVQEAQAPLLVSLAKAKAGEVARLATNEAVQMHGGIGMSDEFDIGLFMKRARAAAETFGDYAFHAERIAQLAGC